MIADRYFATEKVLGVLHIVGGLAMFLAPFVAEGENASATIFILLLLLNMLCYMPTVALTNSLAFHHMTNQEKQFPIIRVFVDIDKSDEYSEYLRFNFHTNKHLIEDKHIISYLSDDDINKIDGWYSICEIIDDKLKFLTNNVSFPGNDKLVSLCLEYLGKIL